MACSFISTGSSDKNDHFHRHFHHHNHQVSPKSSFKKTGSANPPPAMPSSGDGHQHAGGALPKCVCAPATHARSFKCRLHRVNSQGHPAPSAPAADAPASPGRTVEAQ